MPWISGARLTTSGHAQHSWWGSITGKHYSYEVTGERRANVLEKSAFKLFNVANLRYQLI